MRLTEHQNTAQDHRRARELRKDATPAEHKLWIALRKEAVKQGLKFRRQAVRHPFIADFACRKARLLIELDGYSHDGHQGYDKAREEKLQGMGFSILRFNNEHVLENLEGVVTAILDQAEKLVWDRQERDERPPPTPYPLPRGEGEF